MRHNNIAAPVAVPRAVSGERGAALAVPGNGAQPTPAQRVR
jgi:hypothetical protein